MHCEIIDCYFNVFLIEIQPKKENFKCFLSARVWTPKPIYWPPKQPEYITVKIQNPFFSQLLLLSISLYVITHRTLMISHRCLADQKILLSD